MYGIEINRTSMLSNAKQLENQLRSAILCGKLTAGIRILPTRSMAKDLGIARNTVIQAYEQLIAEGYLVSQEGSGTYVADIGRLPNYRQNNPPVPEDRLRSIQAAKQKQEDIISFHAGNPDIKAFPRIQWAKFMKEACLEAEEEAYTYADSTGHPKLRKAISSYIYRVKGIVCDDEQIVIIPGASGGMEILAGILEKKTGKAAVEDPCIDFFKTILLKAGYDIKPAEVDSQGIVIDQLKQMNGVDLIYVVPSHQYPIGGVLPAARRVALLNYAEEQDAYVIEDDYDSEFRYKGEALQALRNLSPERVIYLGSFSKIFSPSLRLGYMILPKHLCESVIQQMELLNTYVSTTEQLAMAEFINQMRLDKHIFKMKKLYEKKRLHLMKCLKDFFDESVTVSGEYAGLHLLASFNRDLSENDFRRMKECGVDIDFVEDYALIKGKHRNQLVLGYGSLNPDQIEEGIRRLSKALVYSINPDIKLVSY